LIRNGSFEGSVKYACQGGEWRPLAGRILVDSETAAVGQYSLRKRVVPIDSPYFNDSVEFAPFLCRRDALYCVSFYAKADADGATVEAWVRGMHPSDNEKWGEYPSTKGPRPLRAEWRRYRFFFAASRLPLAPEVANSYYLSVRAVGCQQFWLDGVQVEEVPGFDAPTVSAMAKKGGAIPDDVAGFPTAFKLHAPVEVCAEAVNLPEHNLYTDEHAVAEVRASIVNDAVPRRMKVSWTLLDHRNRPLRKPSSREKDLAPHEVWLPTETVPLEFKGAYLVRVIVSEPRTAQVINSSDEPVTRLPFDLRGTGNEFDQRFGIALSFSKPKVPLRSNLGLGLLRRMGFRWVRNASPDWAAVEPRRGDWDWSQADYDVEFAREQGFRQFVTIGFYPPWAGGGKFPTTAPADMQWGPDDPRWDDLGTETSFDAYLKNLAARYKGRVEIYQFGNETTASDGPVVDPKVVFRLCRRATRIIRGIDPSAKILGGNMLYVWNVGFWADVLRAGGLDDMDFFGWDFDCFVKDGIGSGVMDQLNAVLKKEGGRSIPLFNYESGWGSGWMQDYPADPIGGARLDNGAIPDEMARSLVSIFAGGTGHFILHLTAYPENLMGSFWSCTRWPTQLYDEQERPRVTLAAYSTIIHYLGLSEFAGPVSRRDWGLEGYAFRDRKGKRAVVAYWSTQPSRQDRPLPLTVPTAVLTSADVMGRERPLPRDSSGAFRAEVKADRAVTFLVGPPGAGVETLAAAFRNLPEKPIHFPAFTSGQPTGVDRLGGAWRVAFVPKVDLDAERRFEEVPKVIDGIKWHPAGTPHAWATIKGDGAEIDLGSHGPTGKPGFENASVLIFTPPRAGRFSVSGVARVYGGEKNRTRVFLGKVRENHTYESIAFTESSVGETEFLEIQKGKPITLGHGESLVLGAYRSEWHWYGGANIAGLQIEAQH
jgi:hypothetical protein